MATVTRTTARRDCGDRPDVVSGDSRSLSRSTSGSLSQAHAPRRLRAAPSDAWNGAWGSQGHSSLTFCRRTIQMKNGAPITAVTMPTWISSDDGETTRPTTSLASSSDAPAMAENGSSQR